MKGKHNSTRITTKEAAEILGTSELYVRVAMQQGVVDIGHFIDSPKKKRRTYYIYKNKVLRAAGIDPDKGQEQSSC